MSRTRRKRLRKVLNTRSQALDHEESVINLRKFMTRNGFFDQIDLKLRNFPDTGRGVSASTRLHENEVLITVPLDLMITYATLKSSNFLQLFNPDSKLTIHDLLTCFLIVQKHKKDSFWKDYIQSLPSETPWLPALLSEQHIELLPVDLRLAAKKSRNLLYESWTRVQRSIKSDWTCGCCGKEAVCVNDFDTFAWGFILVNTRAVYVNPEVIRELCDWTKDGLSDSPCMALCPFLDMFNHSDLAKTEAELIYRGGKWVYQLTTLVQYKKYDQIFISYGGHDNVKLLVEYGFFIPGNSYDIVLFQKDEIFKALQLNLSTLQYKFICKHELDKFLCFSGGEPSFNLKGLLYVSSCDDNEVRNFTSIIYTDDYPENFSKHTLKHMCQKLLQWKMERIEDDLKNLNSYEVNSLIVQFLEWKLKFVKKIYDSYIFFPT